MTKIYQHLQCSPAIVGAGIARQRKAKGLTQTQVAERLGLSPITISRIERGEISTSLTKLVQFKELFQCPLYMLLVSPSIEQFRQEALLCNLLRIIPLERQGDMVTVVKALAVLFRKNDDA